MPALRSAVATSAIPVTVDATGLGRIPTPVEAALYFCCMEAVQNATKHSGGRSVAVHLGEEQHRWHLTVTDDGTGFDQTLAGTVGTGAGLANMRDRLDAVGGTLTIGSLPGSGTTVIAVVPRAEVADQAHPPIPVPGQVR